MNNRGPIVLLLLLTSVVSFSFRFLLDCVTHKARVRFSSLRLMCSFCCLFWGFLVPWSTLESIILRCVRENTTLLASALRRSVESTTEPVVCWTIDPAERPILAEIAVALERGLPCEVAVCSSQQAVGDSGSDVALGEIAVFCMEGGRCSSGSQCSCALASVFVLPSGVKCWCSRGWIVCIVCCAHRRGECCGRACGWARLWARGWTNGVSGATCVLLLDSVLCGPFWIGFPARQWVRCGHPWLCRCGCADWWLVTKM